MIDSQVNQNIWDEYPELFHHTTPVGLESILRTQTLWATQVEFLNDITEFGLFHLQLPIYLQSKIETALLARGARSEEYQRKLEADGGASIVAKNILHEMTQGMHEVLMGQGDNGSILDFFVTSFSAVPEHQSEIKKHGLLRETLNKSRISLS